MEKCNIETYGEGLCNGPAEWKHPRWPTGLYCNEHKKILEDFFKGNWEKIICKEDYDER